MSLDERTLEWLKRRKVFPNRDFNRHYFCAYCDHFKSDRLCVSALCPITAAHVVPRDAAEFEARVAESIARDAHNCALDEMMFQHQEGDKPQGWYILRDARLAVEAKMEKEGK